MKKPNNLFIPCLFVSMLIISSCEIVYAENKTKVVKYDSLNSPATDNNALKKDFVVSLTLKSNVLLVGEKIELYFKSSKSLNQYLWIGIVHREAPHGTRLKSDKHSIDYQYLIGKTKSTLIFREALKPGKYDFRIYETNKNNKELYCVPFEVKPVKGYISLMNKKNIFFTGEEIIVSFKSEYAMPSDAWVGIIPSDVPHGSEEENDKHNIDYRYLIGKSEGTLTFKAPLKPGKYDFRLHDTNNNGTELDSVSFEALSQPSI